MIRRAGEDLARERDAAALEGDPGDSGCDVQIAAVVPHDIISGELEEESARGRPGLVDLVGIDSPGLTSALALAEEVDRLLP